ncbi:MAG TPA: tail fiber domain-containing protein [Blastocatellia bacterium]|nr:tail fiber domain-containing protein [Blastocatellia bacterium]
MARKQVTRYVGSSLMLLIVVFVMSGTCLAQATAFTYQGKLNDTGVPANGNYDLQFKLFDTPTVGTGTQQGATLTAPNVAVTAGIFTAQLDFGVCASCFNGAARFLEIAVKKTSDSTFTTLGPRQPVTASPYAIRSLNAAAADGLSVACVNCVTSSQIQSVQGTQVTGNIAGSQINGAIPVASVPGGSASYIQNTTTQQAISNFNISGNGTAGSTLSGNIVNATTQYNLGGSRVLSSNGANLFAGVSAGSANTTGDRNSFFGRFAGFQNTTETDNTFVGTGAGFQNGTNDTTNSADFNTFVGSNAGNNNTTGGQNSFFGNAAGYHNTTACCNSFFGQIAGFNNSTEHDNTFIGFNTGSNNGTNDTTGNANFNTFVGSQAGLGNTTACCDSFFGYSAGSSNTTEHDNTFLGYRAGQNNGLNDTTNIANFNTFLGSGAGQNNTIGRRNSFLGYQAGIDNTTGSFNAFFGVNAGTLHKTGTFNTFIGFNTGYISVNPTGDNNTLLGYGGTVISGVSNGAAIGALAQVNVSNALVLGSINGVNGATADTSVGIGTTAPLGRLQVVTANDTNPGFITSWDARHFVIGGAASNGGIGMSYDQTNNVGYLEALSPNVDWRNLILQSGGTNTSGRVGIGTSAPDQLLTVMGGASKPGGGSWAVFSDERLKTIKGSFTTGLKALMRLQPLRYEYKRDNALGIHANGEHVGFAAQAIQRIIPEAVTKDEQGYLLLNNDPVVWTMLNAIKEQQREIERMKGQIRRLRASVAQSVSQQRRNPEPVQQLKRKRLATGQMSKWKNE